MHIKAMFLTGAASLLLAISAAGAAEVTEKVEVAAAPDKVWAAIGDFCGIANWHPIIAKCEISEEGKKRTLTTGDGGVLLESMDSRDDAAMSYTYRILESPLPVANYISTIKVTGSGDGSTVEWAGKFDAKGASDEEASKVISGIYAAGLDGLKKKF